MTTKMNLFASAIVAAGVAMSSGAMTHAEAVKLVATPVSQITAANAQAILDAAVQVTNCSAPGKVASARVFSVQEMLSKLDGFPNYMEERLNFKFIVLSHLAQNPASTSAERIDLFNRYVDYWLSKPADVRLNLMNRITAFLSVTEEKGKPEVRLQSTGPEAVAAMTAGCEKLAASGLPDALGQIGWIVFSGGAKSWNGINGGEALMEKWGPQVIEAMKAGKLKCSYSWFNVASWLFEQKNDIAGCISLLESTPDLYTMNHSQTENGTLFCACPQSYVRVPDMLEFGSRLRTSWLKNGCFKTDYAAIRVAKEQDKWAGDKTATAGVWEKLTECSNRVEVACYLGDAGKVIDALCGADESLAPETVMKAVQIINSLDPDFRPADVKKALRVVNKKYTLKLYDDRDAWEPVLSKVRALLDTYSM